MEEIYKTSLLLIHSIAQLDGVCNLFKDTPTVENVDKIAEIVDKCEEKFLKVKEEIVRMVKEVEANQPQPVEQEISAIQTEGGFLINDRG
jgi:hypothetical protein